MHPSLINPSVEQRPCSDVLEPRRATFPLREQGLVSEAPQAFLVGWNFAALMDRRQRLDDKVYMARMLGRQFGAGYKTRREWPLIEAALKAYRTRRAKASGPLRFKKEHRLKTIPAVGFLEAGINEVLKGEGIHPQNVLSKRIRRSGRAWVINVTRQAPKLDPQTPFRRLFQKTRNRARMHGIGLAATSLGIYVLKVNNPQRWNSRRTVDAYLIPADKASADPRGVRDTLQHLFSDTHIVALDESSVPTLPGALRSANTELRRWCRSRKAAGAVEFGMASPVWREVQETMEYAKSVGFNTTDLRRVLKDVRRSFILKCPHCGAPVALALDPHTQVPSEGSVTCSECHVAVPGGILLATRALALVQDDWLHYGGAPRTKGLDRPKTAPSRKTTTSNSTKTRGTASAARPTRVNPVIESELSV